MAVDAMDNDALASWFDHDPRARTTNYLLDGQPYSGGMHPMRTGNRGGLVYYTGVRHTAESRRLEYSSRPVMIPEDIEFLAREERVPRSALDGMFERQTQEQDVYDTQGKLVAIRTIMRERASPFNAERHKQRPESKIITTRLLPTKQQLVNDRLAQASQASAADISSTSAPPDPPPAQSAQTELLPATPSMFSPGDFAVLDELESDFQRYLGQIGNTPSTSAPIQLQLESPLRKNINFDEGPSLVPLTPHPTKSAEEDGTPQPPASRSVQKKMTEMFASTAGKQAKSADDKK